MDSVADHVSCIEITADRVALYSFPSESHPETPNRAAVDLETGACDCDCADFTCRKNPMAQREGATVDIGAVRYHCKHIMTAVRHLILMNEIIVAEAA